MPPTKKPLSLQEIAEARTKEIVDDTCVRIEQLYGSYDNERCREQVNLVQAHLINNIGFFVDRLCLGSRRRSNFVEPQDKIALILLAMVMHTNTRSFYQKNIHLNYYSIGYERDIECYYKGKEFLISKLKSMTNIVKLDLSIVRDAHMFFYVIGKNCKNLEQLTFDSSCDMTHLNFTHVNLLHLKESPKLRVIVDTSYKFIHYNHASIRSFIKRMPQLTYFNFRHLGVILSTKMEYLDTTLSLTCAREENAKPEHIHAFARHCPHLHTLTLMHGEYSKPEETLTLLAESPIKLMRLVLYGYQLNNGIINVLKNKGQLLTSLDLFSWANIAEKGLSKWDLIKIGTFCPQLEKMAINMPVTQPYSYRTANEDDMFERDTKLFRNLTSCQLSTGVDYKDGIVSICLENATRIKIISLRDNETCEWRHTGGWLVNLGNPMDDLEDLNVECTDAYLTATDLTRLYHRFSYVKRVQIGSSHGFISGETWDCLHEIQTSIKNNNYDTDFNIIIELEFFNFLLMLEDEEEEEDN